MALKDWKKTYSWKTGVTYENKKNKSHFIQVYKDNSFRLPYRFTIHKSGKFVDDEQFKTKKEALKYARDYMRKH